MLDLHTILNQIPLHPQCICQSENQQFIEFRFLFSLPDDKYLYLRIPQNERNQTHVVITHHYLSPSGRKKSFRLSTRDTNEMPEWIRGIFQQCDTFIERKYRLFRLFDSKNN